MTNKELNLQPMQEFLTNVIELDLLIKYLDNIYYRFTEMSMKVSRFEDESINEETINCRFWIARLKQVFEEIKN